MGINSFNLQIVTPDGLLYSEKSAMVHVRTIAGNIGVRARHIDYVTALGMGECRVDVDEQTSRYAACIGGLLTVTDGDVRIVATTFEWAEDIDVHRAKEAKESAEQIMMSAQSSTEKKRADAKLKRALVRLSVAAGNK